MGKLYIKDSQQSIKTQGYTKYYIVILSVFMSLWQLTLINDLYKFIPFHVLRKSLTIKCTAFVRLRQFFQV